ncbi:MAG: hypothetical protein ORN54_00535, partial [Cyclobacteriaceae bacterium]|nr:hypothetical protein [Cyclobacteriaceae bacterium]
MRYDKYKNSGIDWVGLMPIHRTIKNKNDCKVVDFSYKNVNVKNIKAAFEHFSNVVVSDFDPLGDEGKLEIY